MWGVDSVEYNVLGTRFKVGFVVQGSEGSMDCELSLRACGEKVL